jgi:cytolysin-activating lysine-acyltransferase
MKGLRGLELGLAKADLRSDMEKRGAVAQLMAQSKGYSGYPLASLIEWINPAIYTDQIMIFYDWKGLAPVGYITWAYLAEDVAHRWQNDPEVRLHESEWNEGETLWIMDFVALSGYCEDIAHYVDQHLFRDATEAFSLRRKPNGRVRKVSRWRHRNRTDQVAIRSDSLRHPIPSLVELCA